MAKGKKGMGCIGVVAVIVITIVIISIAFNSNSDSKDKDSSSKKSISTDSKAGEKTKTTIKEQVLWEIDGIKITATGLSEDSIFGKQIDVLVENNSDKDIGVGVDELIVNDYMITDLTSISVAAGKKSNDSITLFSSDLKAAGIENIGKIELYMHTFDSDSYETLSKSNCITIETSDIEKMDTKNNIDGAVLYEKDGVKIVGQYVDENSFWGTAVLIYVENNTDKNIKVSCDDLSVNGYMITGLFSSTIYAGKKSFDEITLLSSELEQNKITSIEEIETEFKIMDENYKEIANSGKVKFNAK